MRNNNYLSLINFKVKTTSSERFFKINIQENIHLKKKVSDDDVFTLKLT